MKKLITIICAAVGLTAFAGIIAEGQRYDNNGESLVVETRTAEENALSGVMPTLIEGTVGYELSGASLGVLTDGVVPMPAVSAQAAYEINMGDNSTLEFVWDAAKTLDDIRIFSCWGGGGFRNDIVIRKIEYRAADGVTWLVMVPPSDSGFAFGWSINSAYNNVGTTDEQVSRCLTIRGSERGESLAYDATGLRIYFGYQDHGYGGFSEIDAKVRPTNWRSTEMMEYFDDGDDVAVVGDTYRFSTPGCVRFKKNVHLTTVDSDGNEADIGYYRSGETYAVVPKEGGWLELTVEVYEAVPFATVASVAGASDVRDYGNYRAYIFTDTENEGSITFATPGAVSVLAVGGGGAGGYLIGGGGGAGAVLLQNNYSVMSGSSRIKVGAGGIMAENSWAVGGNGGDTYFGDVRVIGGGGGASWHASTPMDGGSGGGGGGANARIFKGVSLAADGLLGHDGGLLISNDCPGGGGGAGGPGQDGQGDKNTAGKGGDGIQCDFTGEMKWYAAGGGGGTGNGSKYAANGGSGIGGDGGQGSDWLQTTVATSGKDGTGSGGGGGGHLGAGDMMNSGHGGSGIVIVRVFTGAKLDGETPFGVADKVTQVTETSAAISAAIYSFGGAESCDIYVDYGPNENKLIYSQKLITMTEEGAFEVVLDDLTPCCDYAARIRIENGSTSVYAEGVLTWKTLGEAVSQQAIKLIGSSAENDWITLAVLTDKDYDDYVIYYADSYLGEDLGEWEVATPKVAEGPIGTTLLTFTMPDGARYVRIAIEDGGSEIVTAAYSLFELCSRTFDTGRYLTNGDLEITGGAVERGAFGPYVYYKLLDTSADYTVTVSDIGKLDYLLIGGGGGGNGTVGAGGGGGGFVWKRNEFLMPADYGVKIGAGGYATSQGSGVNGGETTFGEVIAYGGACGTGFQADSTFQVHLDGASGGGGGDGCPGGKAIYGDQGYDGGGSFYMTPGGGGGAGGPGETPTSNDHAGNGGIGRISNITGVNVYYAGGGGAGAGHISWGFSGNTGDHGGSGVFGKGGLGGGGDGSEIGSGRPGVSGENGLGGGGGGGSFGWENDPATGGGAGGSGVAIIRVLRAGSDYADPIVAIDAVTATDETSVTLDWTVHYTGAGSKGGQLVLRYGRSSVSLDHEFAVKELTTIADFGTVTVTGLEPGVDYVGRLYLDNGLGGGYLPVSDYVSFSTTADVTDDALFDMVSAIRADGDLVADIGFDASLAGAKLFIGFADTYGDWVWTPLDDIAGETQRNIEETIPTGAQYVRFKVEAADGVIYSGSRLLADIEEVDLDAIGVQYVSAKSGSVSVTLTVNVISCGSAESCDLTVAFGNTADGMTREQMFKDLHAGANTVTVKGLTPQRRYYFTLKATNNEGEESAVTSIAQFETTAAVSELPPSPSRPGCVFNGLWQTIGTDGYHTDYANDPTCIFVNGAMATVTKGAWTGIGADGAVVNCDWLGYKYFDYQGYAYFEAGTYYFMGFMGSDCEFWLDGIQLIGSNAIVSYELTAGWHKVELRTFGASGGPHNGLVGIGWRKDSTSTWDRGEDWNAFVDPGDGSFLRTSIPLRDGAVNTPVFGASTLSADIGLSAGAEGTLHVVYGEDYCGDVPSDWTNDEVVTVVGTEAVTIPYSDDYGDGMRYARFYFTDGTDYQWLGGAILLPDPNMPTFAEGLAASGFKGDSIDVSGRVASTGLGETADVSILYSRFADMADAIEFPVGSFKSGESFACTVHSDDPQAADYITPGNLYYIKARLVGEGGLEDMTDAIRVTTGARHVFKEHSQKMSLSSFTGVFEGTLLDPGANGTTVYVLSGANEMSMTNFTSALITEAGSFRIAADFPFVKETVFCKMVISNGCATASWVEETPVESFYIYDDLTYRWVGKGADINWETPENWETGTKTRANFPNSDRSTVIFETDDVSIPIRAHVNGYYYAASYRYLTPNMKVEISGNGYANSVSRLEANYSNITMSDCFAPGIELTFTEILYDTPTMYYKDGMTLNLDHTFYHNKNQQGGVFFADNVTINLRNDALYQFINDHTFFDGENLHIVVDNSTFYNSCGGIMYCGWNQQKASIKVDLYGDHPVYQFNNQIYVAKPNRPEFCFHLPEGGYTNGVPLVIAGDPFVTAASSDYGIDISVAADSPALERGKAFETKLYETAGTMPVEMIEFKNCRRTKLGYDEDVKSIWAKVVGGGLMIFIK